MSGHITCILLGGRGGGELTTYALLSWVLSWGSLQVFPTRSAARATPPMAHVSPFPAFTRRSGGRQVGQH